jgi:hypothetical protein
VTVAIVVIGNDVLDFLLDEAMFIFGGVARVVACRLLVISLFGNVAKLVFDIGSHFFRLVQEIIHRSWYLHALLSPCAHRIGPAKLGVPPPGRIELLETTCFKLFPVAMRKAGMRSGDIDETLAGTPVEVGDDWCRCPRVNRGDCVDER